MWTRRRLGAIGIAATFLMVVGVTAVAAPSTARPSTTRALARPWLNRSLTPTQRALLLRAQMTLGEKVDLMTGNQGEAPYAFYNAPIPRLGIPALKMADAGSGVASRGWSLPGTGGSATAMPAEIALGATWSAAEATRFARIVADEVRETGQNVLLGPDTDIAREPWFGRISESEGEDPILNAGFNSAYVREIQAHDVIATLKHYTGYNQETNRNIGQNSIISQRALREVYALAFESVIARAGLGAVMCSYNKINGEYSCDNAETDRHLLKGRLKFTGFVMTDFGALHDTLSGLQAGTDMETGTSTFYDGALLDALQSGQASLAQVDQAVLRILITMFRLGLFDNDYSPTSIPVAAHDAVARSVEDKAITLLKNAHHALPLTGATAKSIALIGADANILAAEGGSAYVTPTVETPTLQGLANRAGAAAVTWVPGNDAVNGASMIETAHQTTVPSSVLTPASGTGTGLTAQYWHTPDFTGPPALTRTDKQVSYDMGFPSTFPGWAGGGTQVPLPPFDFFLEQQSVRYDGFITAPVTGTYTLSLTGWGDATMTLDGQTIIAMTGHDGRRVVNSAPLILTAGSRHRLHIDYRASRPLTPLQPGTLLLQWKPPSSAQSPAMVQAVNAARHAKVAIVYVRTFESEERDRVSLKLPQSANQLIRAVAAVNPRTIVVLASGGPVTMPWIRSVSGVVQTYFGGQAQGAALADVLFGDVNPSGRLPLTYPSRETDVPVPNPWNDVSNLDVVYREGVNVGYKAYDRAGIKPLFPFGYGLSYTKFVYTNLPAPKARLEVGSRSVHVRFCITNVGTRAGTETAQVYLGLPSSTGEPPKRLVGTARVTLAPHQSRVVDVQIRPHSSTHPLSYYDAARQRWITAFGTYHVYIGASSRDVRLQDAFQIG
jgi:beta-glucosidase